MDKVDIVLIATPVMEDLRFPPPGIFQLKGVLNENGYSSRCYDLAKETSIAFNDTNKIDQYLSGNDDNETKNQITQYYKKFIEEKVLPLKPDWVGISIFSYLNIKAAVILSKILKEKDPNIKIIVGGAGTVGTNLNETNIQGDYWVEGDGEIALLELLQTNIQPVKTKEKDVDLNNLPYADYSDYNNDYGVTRLIITGSRGCIFNCTPCDTKAFWKMFRQRSAENIYNEILEYKKLYNISYVFFSDSLINGNMKVFRELLMLLSKENLDLGGHFAIRKELTTYDYLLMNHSRFRTPIIGVESGSEKVRKTMGKHFTNEELHFTMENIIKNRFSPYLLFLIGYPTETEEDFQETIKFLEYYSSRKGDLKFTIGLGPTLFILRNTPLERSSMYKLQTPKSKLFWESTVVPGLDFPERFRRRKLIGKIAKELGYNLRRESEQIIYLNKKLELYYRLQEKGEI